MKKRQIELLGNYIMANCPLEIGVPCPEVGEGAGDVAIRMMGRMANGIEDVLHELEIPRHGHLPSLPLEDITETLRGALGLWGKGVEVS